MRKFKLPMLAMIVLSIVFTQSCKKDDDVEENKEREGGFYVINEGGFGSANSSLGYVHSDWTFTSSLYKQSNDVLLGDVFQSMIEKDQKYYMVINNSSKIEIVDKTNLTNKETIENLGSPNHIKHIGTKLFVNDLYGANISYFEQGKPDKLNTLNLNGPLKSMQVSGTNLIGIVNGKLLRIDGATVTEKDSFDYGVSLVAIRVVENKGIYGLAKGTEDSLFSVKIAEDGSLVSKSFIEKNTNWLSIFRTSTVNQAFYFINGDKLYSIDFADIATVSKTDIPSIITATYGFNLHPQSGEFYFCDAMDYVKNGKVVHTDKTGKVLNQVEVGINPNSIFFN